MLSAPSFKKQLSQFRPQFPVPRYEEILARWKKYPSINEDWRKIQETAHDRGHRALDANEFINLVLSATWPVDSLIEHTKAGKLAFEECKDEILAVVKSGWQPLELARQLENFVERLRSIDKSNVNFNMPVSRKDQKGSRQRKAFALTVGVYLRKRCGEWCDKEVAALIDIAYPRSEATSIDEVRLFRAPTTHMGRADRPRD